MSAQETPVSRQPDKRKQRDARKDLSTFLKKLQKACSTFETANDWVDFVGELNGLLQIYQFEIPVDRQDGLKQAMNLADPTREGIAQACQVLQVELKKAIDSLPAGGSSCGCLGGSLAAVLIGLAIIVGLIVAIGAFLLRPVEVNVVNVNCGPIFVRQGVPPELQPVVNFLGVKLPDVIDTNGEGLFRIPGIPIQVGVNGAGRETVAISVLGINVPFGVSDNTAFIEVNGNQVLGNSFRVGMRDFTSHTVIIGCE